MDTHIKQFLCAVLLTFPELRLWSWVPAATRSLSWFSTDRAIVVKPPTHYTLTNYWRGVGSHIQTNRWQFLFEKLGQFYSEISAIYCTLYIITIFLILNSQLFVCLLKNFFTNTASSVLVTWNNLLLHYTQITWLYCILLVIFD